MRIALLLAALLAGGCASSKPSRAPGTLPTPTTLAGVNAVLTGTPGTIHYTDGRPSEVVFIQVGPETSLVRSTTAGASDHSRTVLTEDIAFIEVDDSRTTAYGAEKGLGLGALPGLSIATAGLAIGTQCEEFGCGVGAAYMMAGGGVALVLGALAGAAAGAASTSRRYPVIVYEGPVSRYPDAAVHASSRPRSVLELAE